MAWNMWNKNDANLPEALRGKSPEEIDTELKRLSASVGEVERLKEQLAERDTKLSENSSAVEQMQQKIQELESGSRPNPDLAPRKPASFLDDEDQAFNDRAAPLVNGLMDVSAQTAKIVAEQRIRANPAYAKLLSKYQADVDKLYKTVPLQYQRFPETYERVFKQVLGDHVEELMTEQAKTGGSLFIESGGGAQPPAPPPNEQLTADELEAAKRLKIDPEQMLASKKQMRSIGGHISFGRNAA
jgi:ABC-type transporter Mla subunit MlaD